MSRPSGADLIGTRRGKYTIRGVTEKHVGKNLLYFVQCDCKVKMFKTLHHLNQGHEGCRLDRKFKHTPVNARWWNR